MKVHLVIPMAGRGSRFKNKGISTPKPLVMLNDRPFFWYAVESVAAYTDVADITFVVLQEHIDNFKIDEEIKKYYPDANIKVIPEVTEGAVCTALTVKSLFNDNMPVIFNDCDHAFVHSHLQQMVDSMISSDAMLMTFESNEPQFSYVCFDTEENITGTVEKKVVSDKAIFGAYLFKNMKTFVDAAEVYLKECEYKEFFMSGVYNVLCKQYKLITYSDVDAHYEFGTPEEYDNIIKSGELNDVFNK